MEVFKNLQPCFQEFITLDSNINSKSPLMLRFIYPNGDEFIIRRLHGKDKLNLIFVTHFIPLSKYVEDGEQTSYNMEYFREKLETQTSKTIEELSEDGQLILVAVSLDQKYL